ncbi:hypothetical protein ACHAXT_012754 [Thalassiosira profunda]
MGKAMQRVQLTTRASSQFTIDLHRHTNLLQSNLLLHPPPSPPPTDTMCSEMKTGTKAYMSLYPEGSTDGGLRLGNVVPDFAAETTQGSFDSFHEWKKGKWAILFSHPADFTPVCTTEIGRLALKYDQLEKMDCLVATLSVDPVKSHTEWLNDVVKKKKLTEILKYITLGRKRRSRYYLFRRLAGATGAKWLNDVVAHCENNIEIKFPIIGDSDRKISTAYGMIDPGTSDEQSLPLTIRAVFIINPENKLMLSLNYPACVGRNMDEIVRCVQALQLSYEKSIATPANWPNNHAEIPLADGTRTDEYKGSVFLLPTRLSRGGRGGVPRIPHVRGSLQDRVPASREEGGRGEGGGRCQLKSPGVLILYVPMGTVEVRAKA